MSGSHHFELHQVGTRTMLALAPRGTAIGTDEVHVGIGAYRYDTYGKSVLLSRAQVRDLHAWLGAWLAEGWPGVAPQEGPTNADVIEHYRDVASRERIAADHERIRVGRLLAAALTLIPAEARAGEPDLAAIANDEAAAWKRLQDDADRGENARRIFVQGLHEIGQWLQRRHDARTRRETGDDAEQDLAKVRKALKKLADRGANPHV